MSIDNHAEAIALTKKIEASLPITAYPSKEYLKLMKKQGKQVSGDQALTIDSVLYMGEEGGISCGIKPKENDKQVYVVSITHLNVDPNHPLASEIRQYQRQRSRNLMLENSRGFMAEMTRLSKQSTKQKKKSDRGFGK
jgi:hypothetical protein